MKTAVALIALASLAGCAVSPPPVLTIVAPFDEAALAWAKAPGSNTISGDALLRTVGGEVKTCAGLDVSLTPKSPYVEEYMARRFNSFNSGYSPYGAALQGNYALNPALGPYVIRKKCNAQGAFNFSGLPDGAYYVVANVTWQAVQGYGAYTYLATQGGEISQLVEVAGGKEASITLTR